MQYIEYNKENHQILNQIYNILAELQEQGKKIIMCKEPAANEALDMPGVPTTRLPYTDYYLAIRRARNS